MTQLKYNQWKNTKEVIHWFTSITVSHPEEFWGQHFLDGDLV